jgi:hypothetical protein
MEVVLEASHSHLYPGLEGVVAEGELSPAASPIHARIMFADGAVAAGVLARDGDGNWSLSVDPYRTVRGTDIAAKRWALAFTGDEPAGMRFRIRKKLAV